MCKIYILLPIVSFFLLFGSGCGRSGGDSTNVSGELELAIHMAWAQRWTDKLGRAMAAGNWELMDFYLHELEENAEELVDREIVYEGHPVGQLTQAMLLPVIESLEDAVDSRDIELFRDRYTLLIQACNACHVATDHGYLRIAAPDLSFNPWAQDFAPLEE